MSNKSGTGKKTKIGGQALMEGIVMRGVSTEAMATRMKDGSIDIEEWSLPEKRWYEKAPVIRGSVNFVKMLIDGYKCMMKSAEKSGAFDDDENEEPTKFEKWLSEKLGENLLSVLTVISTFIGILLAVVLFFFVPSYLYTGIESLISADISVWRTTFEGVIKIALFVLYMALVAQMKDIRRTYEYHGAEHKTIACYEAGKELTAENIRGMTRFHPRCGTSFIIITLLVSILVYSVVPITPEMFKTLLNTDNEALAIVMRTAVKLLLLPLVVGIAYELIRVAGRYDNIVTKIFSAPGLWMQRITTREPDDSQIEVAVAALTPCLPKPGEDDSW